MDGGTAIRIARQRGVARTLGLGRHDVPLRAHLAVPRARDRTRWAADGDVLPRLDALRALTPPPGDAATIKTLLDDQAKVMDAIEADPNTFTKLAADPFAEVDTRWDAYGLTQCGSRSALPSSS